MRTRDDFHRHSFHFKRGANLTFPKDQLLPDIGDVFYGGSGSVLFADLKTDIAQLKAMYILSVILRSILFPFRSFYLNSIRDFLSIEIIFLEGLFFGVLFCIRKTVPAPLALRSQRNAFGIFIRK